MIPPSSCFACRLRSEQTGGDCCLCSSTPLAGRVYLEYLSSLVLLLLLVLIAVAGERRKVQCGVITQTAQSWSMSLFQTNRSVTLSLVQTQTYNKRIEQIASSVDKRKRDQEQQQFLAQVCVCVRYDLLVGINFGRQKDRHTHTQHNKASAWKQLLN